MRDYLGHVENDGTTYAIHIDAEAEHHTPGVRPGAVCDGYEVNRVLTATPVEVE